MTPRNFTTPAQTGETSYQILDTATGRASPARSYGEIAADIRAGTVLPDTQLADASNGRIVAAREVPVFATVLRQQGYDVPEVFPSLQPTDPTQTITTKTPPTFAEWLTPGRAVGGGLGLVVSVVLLIVAVQNWEQVSRALLVMILFFGGIAVIFMWAMVNAPAKCGFCGATIKRTSYRITLEDGTRQTACPDCNRNLQRKISAAATKNVKVSPRR